MKKLPIGITAFDKMSQGNSLYVDKTRLIFDLITQGGGYYFLSRPRRFGKSLLVSTLKEIFLGHQELFQGVYIYDKIDWTPHPVINLDCSHIDHTTPDTFEAVNISKTDAEILHIRPRSPVLLRNDVVYSTDGKIIAYNETTMTANYKIEGLMYIKERL